jgi:hypothetical protein
MAKKQKNQKKKTEFSKALLIQETILIWVLTLSFIGLTYLCIVNQYIGELAWLASVYAIPWAAYGVSQACYYKKAEKENTKGGIKYDSIMRAAETVLDSDTIEKIQNLVYQNDKDAEEENFDDFEDAVG